MDISSFFRQAKWDRDPISYVNNLVSSGPPYNYMQFSDIIKLGINPRTGFATPIGIYSYPITPEIKEDLFKVNLPFAADREYIIFFKSKIDSNVLYSSRANNIGYSHLKAKLVSRAFDKEWDYRLEDTLDERLRSIKRWESQSYSKTDLGKLWNVTRMLANRKIMPWTSILLRLGIDGIVDDTGLGIIHTNEPTQAIFFLRTSVKQIGTFPNVFTSKYRGKNSELIVLLAKGGGKVDNEEISCEEVGIKKVRNAHLTKCTFMADKKVLISNSVFTKCKVVGDYGSKFVKSTFIACNWNMAINDNVILENCTFERCNLRFISTSGYHALTFKNVFMDDASKKAFFEKVPERLLSKFAVEGNIINTK